MMDKKVKKEKKEKELDLRQQACLINYLSPASETMGNAKASALKAGYKGRGAALVVTQEWFRDRVRRIKQNQTEQIDAIRDAIDPERIIKVLGELEKATQKRTFVIKDKKTGKVKIIEKEVPDWRARNNFVIHALKLGIGGGYAPEKHIVGKLSGRDHNPLFIDEIQL